jgi:hypothetical protein
MSIGKPESTVAKSGQIAHNVTWNKLQVVQEPINLYRVWEGCQTEPEVQCLTGSPMPCGPGVTPLKWNMTRTPGDRCSVVSGPDPGL